jgi:hypothetical protein
MRKKTEKEVAALVTQCESALVEFSNRTGASVFSQELDKPASKIRVKPPAVSKQALAKIAKNIETSASDMSELMVKLEVHLAAKTNDLSDWKLQREVLVQKKQQSRQADLKNKRNAMYRHADESQTGAEAANKQEPLYRHAHQLQEGAELANKQEPLSRHARALQEGAAKAPAASEEGAAKAPAASEEAKSNSKPIIQETTDVTGKTSFGGGSSRH